MKFELRSSAGMCSAFSQADCWNVSSGEMMGARGRMSQPEGYTREGQKNRGDTLGTPPFPWQVDIIEAFFPRGFSLPAGSLGFGLVA